ncbi:MAG: hypothetical protein ACLP3K_14610 [Candidatus Acidiferrales bacterium]
MTLTLPTTRVPITGPSPVTESFIVSAPLIVPSTSVVTPVAVLILLPGGDGDIHLTAAAPDGTLGINSSNFLTRSRWLFAGHNFYVLTLDAASDYLLTPAVLTGHQGDADHISDVEAVIQYARMTYPGLPVWLVGTSRGTAGAFVAASAPPLVGPDGLVFTSAINGTSPPDPDSLLSTTLTLSSITVPVLLVNDLGNTCMNTLPTGDPAVKKALTGAPIVNIINIAAGGLLPLTDNCDALSDHGYFGRERIAVQEISNWIIAH